MLANEHSRKSKVDVLIVGAGPAGLMAATWLARQGVSVRIVDKRNSKVYNGQADGMHVRTLEIFDSFGIASRATRELSPLSGFSTWTPDYDGALHRAETMRVVGDFLPPSRFNAGALHQGRIERFLIDAMAEFAGTTVERGVLPESLEVDVAVTDDVDAYPIRLRLRHLTEEEATPKAAVSAIHGQTVQNGLYRSNMAADDTAEVLQQPLPQDGFTEDVEARYLVGCDGAHSWIRNQVGIKLQGESTDHVWGVVDLDLITDFPDSRVVCTIQSAGSGSILWIPRERGLTRIYAQLSKVNTSQGGAKFDRSAITPDLILESARKILHPYKFKVNNIEWWTVYQVGQRVADRFAFHNRVFLAGDAVHTHSPKMGQGMNVSMGDTYNLGWKLGAVVQGLSRPSLMATYESERRTIAQQLIDFDSKLSRVFSGGPPKDVLDKESNGTESLFDLYHQNLEFITGMHIDYAQSLIVAKDDSTNSSTKLSHIRPQPLLATGIQIGRRVPDHQVINQFDDCHYHLHKLLPSNGRWRILLFAGDLTQTRLVDRLHAISEQFNSPESPIRRFTPATRAIDSVIELITIHANAHSVLADFTWPPAVRPFSAAHGWDHRKIFADDHGTRTYAKFGVDPQLGCAVVVRPDQYVSWVGAVDDAESVQAFFDGFMVVQAETHEGAKGPGENWAGY